jgi:tetratricopeptide (TPR) repeat protein
MNDSVSTSEYLEQNLLERFFLERQLEILPAYMRGTKKTISYQDTYKENLLNDLFVERVLQDPYFSVHICKEVEKSDFEFKSIFAYIQYIILEQYLHKTDLLRKKNDGCNQPLSKSNNVVINLIKSFNETDSINSLKYNDFYRLLFNCDNEDLINAIKHIPTKKEKLNVRWQDRSPFSWYGIDDLYSRRLMEQSKIKTEWSYRIQIIEQREILNFLKDFDFRAETRFLHENIKAYFRYSIGSDKRYLKVPFIAFLNFDTHFLIDIKNTLLNHGFMSMLDDNEIAEHLKFFMDGVFICQFSWFNSLNEEDKIKILNHYYDTFDISIKESNLNLFGKNSLLHILAYNETGKLYENKDYENAVAILDTIIKSIDDSFLKYSCTSFVANIYQEKNEYEKSLEYFTKAYTISKDFTNDLCVPKSLENIHSYAIRYRHYRRHNLGFIQYIEFLNIAEMNCYRGNKVEANKYLKALDEQIKVFSLPKQIIILGHLAGFCSHHQKMLRRMFLDRIIEISKNYENKRITDIENDVKDEVFSMLRYEENYSNEKCIEDWINSKRKYAFDSINESENISSTSQINSDLIKVCTNYNQCLHYNPEGVDQVELVIKTANIASKLYDVHAIFSSTIEPHRCIDKIKSIIMDFGKIEGIEKQKYHDLSYGAIIERLNLEMARCHYTLDNLDAAEDILKGIIAISKDDDILFNSYCLLGIALIKLRDERSGIKNLEKAIEMDFRDDYLFNYIRDELSSSPNVLYRVSESIANTINMKLHNEEDYQKNGYLLAAREFNEFGLTDEAMHFIEKGLQAKDNQILKMHLLEEKAYVSYLDCDYDKAKETLEDIVNIALKALKIDNIESGDYYWSYASALHKLSLIYAKRRDFKEASEAIDLAIETLSTRMKDYDDIYKLKRWDGLKDTYSFFANDSLLLKKINNRQVLETLETAEYIFFDVSSQNKHKNFDYSLALVEYGKGLETLMHDFISVKLRNKIFICMSTPIDKKYWYGGGKEGPEPLTPELRNILGIEKERTISLGQWKPLILDVFTTDIEIIQNPYIKDSYYFLESFMTKDEWNDVVEACAIMSEYRNGSAHYGKKEFKDIIYERKEIVEEINKVISIIHSLENIHT